MSTRPFPTSWTVPPRVEPGDRVAVLSPSWAGPAFFPRVFDLGLERLRTELGLVPVEFPTTRRSGASPGERAADVNEAFADPSIRAVLTSIGGVDGIKVLPHLEADVIAAHPKLLVGYSDNTNLLLYLWNLGIVGYHGPSVMAQLARAGRPHPTTVSSLRTALFAGGTLEVAELGESTDEDGDWAAISSATPAALTLLPEPALRPAAPWSWHGPTVRVTGPAWGGCLEIIDLQLRVDRWLAEPAAYDGAVLVLETSEQQPPSSAVESLLTAMGERGMLQRFAAVLLGRPKSTSADRPRPLQERAAYAVEQIAAVVSTVAEYLPGDGDNPGIPIVANLDIGHTDPQLVVPMGGAVTVDLVEGRISFEL